MIAHRENLNIVKVEKRYPLNVLLSESHFRLLPVGPSTDIRRHWVRDRPRTTADTLLYDCKDCWGIFKMATSNSDVHTTDDDPSSKISPWARGENLRHVEKEVLIPKIVREKAKAKCDDFVKGRLHVEQRCFIDRANADFFQGCGENVG